MNNTNELVVIWESDIGFLNLSIIKDIHGYYCRLHNNISNIGVTLQTWNPPISEDEIISYAMTVEAVIISQVLEDTN